MADSEKSRKAAKRAQTIAGMKYASPHINAGPATRERHGDMLGADAAAQEAEEYKARRLRARSDANKKAAGYKHGGPVKRRCRASRS